jgi:hypothetical protein
MEKSFKHLMVDIETLGTSNDSVILSIAAVEFDIRTGETGKNFFVRVDIDSCLDCGLKIDGSTVKWWLSKSEEARREVYDGKCFSLLSAITQFEGCFNLKHKEYKMWANSPRFDFGIMQSAYRKLGRQIPWDFRDEMDVRTLDNLFPSFKNQMENSGVAHNPLDDCHFQIKYITEIHKRYLADSIS